MSMTIEIKIKGELIHHISVMNKGPIIPPVENNRYSHTYHYTSIRIKTGGVTKGTVKHNRRGGVQPLLTSIMKDITKKSMDIDI